MTVLLNCDQWISYWAIHTSIFIYIFNGHMLHSDISQWFNVYTLQHTINFTIFLFFYYLVKLVFHTILNIDEQFPRTSVHKFYLHDSPIIYHPITSLKWNVHVKRNLSSLTECIVSTLIMNSTTASLTYRI